MYALCITLTENYKEKTLLFNAGQVSDYPSFTVVAYLTHMLLLAHHWFRSNITTFLPRTLHDPMLNYFPLNLWEYTLVKFEPIKRNTFWKLSAKWQSMSPCVNGVSSDTPGSLFRGPLMSYPLMTLSINGWPSLLAVILVPYQLICLMRSE